MATPTFAAARALGMTEAQVEFYAAFLSGKNSDESAFTLPISGTITATTTPGVVPAATATLANVDVSAGTNVTLLAASATRLGATFYNDSASGNLFLKFGATASSTSFTIKIAAGGYYELPTTAVYTGRIDGIADAAVGSAAVRVTSLST